MSVIKFNSQDIKLKFSLSDSNKFTGYQQEIDKMVEDTSNSLINPVTDTEIRRFKYLPSNPAMTLRFFFNLGASWVNYFPNLVVGTNLQTYNSFFILDLYDTFNSNIQSKIMTTYLTKIDSASYVIDSTTPNQFYHWNIPLSYTGTTAYARFSFYNATDGTLSLFYNNDNSALKTPEKMYFRVELNQDNRTWRIITTSFPIANAYQLPNSSAYVARVNNGISNFENKKQVFPAGDTFQYTTGTYSTE